MTGRTALVPAFTGPVAYSSVWTWLAVAAVLAVVTYYAGAMWLTRPRKPEPVSSKEIDVTDARDRTLARLAAIEAALAAGTIGERTAYGQVSTAARGFVEEVTGAPVTRMTLEDVTASGLPRIPGLVGLLYPPQFAPERESSPAAAIDAARELVATWPGSR